MKIDYIKLAGIFNVPIRIGAGLGVGYFTRRIVLSLVENQDTATKVATWFGAICTAAALGYAVDCYCNKAIEYCEEIIALRNTSASQEE